MRFRRKVSTDAHAVVTSLYSSLLARLPRAEEADPVVQFVRAGGSVHDVVAMILRSGECQAEFYKNPVFDDLLAPDPLSPDVTRLYVLHIPKTAGTSLREMLRPHFGPLEFCGGLTLSEFCRTSLYRLWSFRVIIGHFGSLVPQLLADVPVVTATLVRDPVSVVISNYTQHRDRGHPLDPLAALAKQMPFEDWCRSDGTRWLWSNPQATSLASPRFPPNQEVADVFPEGSPGSHPGPGSGEEFPEGELLSRSLATLANTDIVGTTEEILEVYGACLRTLGIEPTSSQARVENRSAEFGHDLSAATTDWLLEHNDIDAALFAEAKERGSLLSVEESMWKDAPPAISDR